MAKILAHTPPINHEDIFERERKKELRKKSEEQSLSSEEKKEWKRLLTKTGEADDLFEQVNCLQIQRKVVKDVNKELALLALDTGIVIGTMGLGSVAVAGRLALRAGSHLSKTQKLSKAKRFQNMGIFGTDVSLSTPYMKEAMNICEDSLNQLEETVLSQEERKACEKLPVRVKHTSDLKSCILQASLASLPITLPILGLSGIALAKKFGKKPSSPTPSSASLDKAEAVLGTKLNPKQREAIEKAHLVGRGEKGKNGSLAGIGNYTEAQLRRKSEILKKAGFSKKQRRTLMEKGVVGDDLVSGSVKGLQPKKPLDTVDSDLSKGAIQFREAYNRGFFTQNERYISIVNYAENQGSMHTHSVYIKSYDGDRLVIQEVGIDGSIRERKLSDDEILQASVSPIGRGFFESMDSPTKEVGLVQYSQWNKQMEAEKQGFQGEMVQGLDEAYKMSELASHLRNSNINPYKTHIEDFSISIPERIRYIREGIQTKEKMSKRLDLVLKGEENLFPQVKKRLQALDELASEASQKQREKGVTYVWYLEWNQKLSQLATRQKLYDEFSHLDRPLLSDLIESFPYFVHIPTTQSFGIMAFNKSISENVFPLGVSNKIVFADGLDFTPHHLFNHDTLHSRNILQSHVQNNNFPYGKNRSMTAQEFYNKLQNADIPLDQKKKAEIMYFFNAHDVGNLYDDTVNIPVEKFTNDESLLQLLPESVRRDKEKIQSYLEEAVDIYENILQNQ